MSEQPNDPREQHPRFAEYQEMLNRLKNHPSAEGKKQALEVMIDTCQEFIRTFLNAAERRENELPDAPNPAQTMMIQVLKTPAYKDILVTTAVKSQAALLAQMIGVLEQLRRDVNL